MANATVTVLEADGVTETDVVVLDVGRQAAAASKSVATATEDKAVLDAMAASLAIIDNFVATSVNSGNKDATTQRVTLATDDIPIAAVVSAINSAASPIVNLRPETSDGLSIHRSIDLDEGALEVVKGSAGQVYSMWVANLATSTRFIKFYNATSGTAGTGTPVLTIPIPGNSSDDIAGVFNAGSHGVAFSTGICVGATTGVADADTGAPGANEVIVNIFFK
jgi:hypothetical protein